MGKKLAILLVAAASLFGNEEEETTEYPCYEMGSKFDEAGFEGGSAKNREISASMFGWGIFLAVGITILSLTLPSSTGS